MRKVTHNVLFKHWADLLKEMPTKVGKTPIDYLALENLQANAKSKAYFVRNDALELIDRIKHKNELPAIIDQIPITPYRLYFEDDPMRCVVLNRTEIPNVEGQVLDCLTWTIYWLDEGAHVLYSNLNFDIEAMDWNWPSEEHRYNPDWLAAQDYFKERIYPTLLYLFCSELELVEVQPQRIANVNKIATWNDTKDPVTLVTSKWNTVRMSQGAIDVRGHFAVRAHGEGRKLRKLVYIAPYQKNGYTRRG